MRNGEWLQRKLDELHLTKREGMTSKERRDHAHRLFNEGLKSGEIVRRIFTAEEEADYLLNTTIESTRQKRKKSLSDNIEYLLDALDGDTILGKNDPALWIPYAVGSTDGRDKVFAYWTEEDVKTWMDAREDNRVKADESAKRAAVLGKTLIKRLRAKGVVHVVDLGFKVADADEAVA